MSCAPRQRRDRVERSRQYEDDREEREEDREDAHEVAPPVVGQDRAPSRGHPARLRSRDGLGVVERRHRISSSVRVRQNEIAEMPATMKKMKIDTAAARPYWAPPPAWKAILYV